MSVKFQEEAVRTVTGGGKPEDLVHRVGERLTGGKTAAGYLQAYLLQLQKNPLRTKMLTSGVLSAPPLGHVLVGILQKIFAGRTSLKAKILQILVSNLIISPIQNSVYLTSMAIIAGARTLHQVRATVKAGFMPVMKVSWITSPLCLAFAQKFLPEHTWVPFFNIVGFFIGTYVNTHTKKKRLEALRKRYDQRRDPGYEKRDFP
ncbi:hypothetical protein N7516_000462 [Penicillium verrucosum]|uniref:uncharacterized protein n=1 Tax=Penicillium verrucosum TaxID=60171 RepID=UPI002544DE0C|nr:uncharacterized protein N7516_000462 [Penicillium verrucosum]KAJ5940294.1 hypothetical protein N7516_000462 [Penicillium verrucosum]